MSVLKAVYSEDIEPDDVVQLHEAQMPFTVVAVEKGERMITLVRDLTRARYRVTYGLPVILIHRPSTTVDTRRISDLCEEASIRIPFSRQDEEEVLTRLGDAIDSWRLNRPPDPERRSCCPSK